MPVFLLVLVLLGIGLTTSVAQDRPAECKDGSKTINFWHGLTGPDGAYLADMVKQYNTDNADNLCVILTVYNWDVFFDKWLSGVAAGTPPDVVIYHINELPQYASLGAVTPIDDLAAGVGLDGEQLPGNAADLLALGRQIIWYSAGRSPHRHVYECRSGEGGGPRPGKTANRPENIPGLGAKVDQR